MKTKTAEQIAVELEEYANKLLQIAALLKGSRAIP